MYVYSVVFICGMLKDCIVNSLITLTTTTTTTTTTKQKCDFIPTINLGFYPTMGVLRGMHNCSLNCGHVLTSYHIYLHQFSSDKLGLETGCLQISGYAIFGYMMAINISFI